MEEHRMKRPLTEEERTLVAFILGGVEKVPQDALVEPMMDGGMGSLRFISNRAGRRFGVGLGEVQFTDSDGVLVSATVNTDQFGDLFELDIWKVDFSPLHRIPPASEFKISK